MMNESVLGRLLSEISWDGTTVRKYRKGGQGYENVLSAEALQGLDFLPRRHFLGAVIQALHGHAEQAKKELLEDVEDARFTLLPGNIPLNKRVQVQPDGILVTTHVFALVEAKRILSSSFQREQLAREYVVLTREAKERRPLLLLILGEPPPVRVAPRGRKELDAAICANLREVWGSCKDHPVNDCEELETAISSTVAWITWAEINQIIQHQRATFTREDASVEHCVGRLARSVTDAIQRHGRK